MTYLEIINLAKQHTDETDIDEQIDSIIKQAINHSYLFDLCSMFPTVTTTYVPSIQNILTLPNDMRKIIDIEPKLTHGEKRIGNIIKTNQDTLYTITYATSVNPLNSDTDIPEVPEQSHYLMVLYACYAYFEHRKKPDIAQTFLTEYNNNIARLEYEYLGDMPEQVGDIYG